MAGQTGFDKTKDFLDNDAEFDTTAASKVCPYIIWIYLIGGTFGRTLLIAISYKIPNVAKMYIYYETIMFLLYRSIP